MLIEFRFKNFRSFRDEQVLNLVASKDKTLPDNTFSTGLYAAPTLLRSSIIYGANASGKSNMLKSLQCMRSLIAESAIDMQERQLFGFQSFLLDERSINEPTEFEVTFLIDGMRYQYGFALTPQRIVHEYLLVYKKSKTQRWFERRYDEENGQDRYEFDPALQGQKNIWKNDTHADTLFLSMAVHLNINQLCPVFDWITNKILIINELNPFTPDLNLMMTGFYMETTEKVDEHNRKIYLLLQSLDILTDDIDNVIRHLNYLYWNKKNNHEFKSEDGLNNIRTLYFLVSCILNSLETGKTLFIDDLEMGLHPLTIRRLIELFHDPKKNKNKAQLIFTTHNTSLLGMPCLFRNDQIWFVERNENHHSTLYSLSDFNTTKNESIESAYLTGRYGAIPIDGVINIWE